MGRAAALTVGALLALVAASACYRAGEPQLVVQVDTDVLTPADARARETATFDAAFDRLRVVTVWPSSGKRDNRDILLPSRGFLPATFGVPAGPDGDPEVEITLTLYKQTDMGALSETAEVPPALAITRVVRVRVPDDDRSGVRVTLRGECLGVAPDRARGLGCVDDPRRLAPFDASVEVGRDDAPTAAGTWPRGDEVPCRAEKVKGRVCVEGGLTVVGERAAAAPPDPRRVAVDRPRAASLEPFWLDVLEVTVSDLRQLFARGLAAEKPPTADQRAGCNYRDALGPGDFDAARCVTFATARAACRARGGDLPTAAQWEHAARGRGNRYRYPWGFAEPRCCTAALARGRGCSDAVSLETGTHLGDGCDSADVTRDGAADLGGSVREWVLDRPVPWDDPCYGVAPIADNLACVDGVVGSARGGSFLRSLSDATAVLRWRVDDDVDVGFRCAYGDAR